MQGRRRGCGAGGLRSKSSATGRPMGEVAVLSCHRTFHRSQPKAAANHVHPRSHNTFLATNCPVSQPLRPPSVQGWKRSFSTTLSLLALSLTITVSPMDHANSNTVFASSHVPDRARMAQARASDESHRATTANDHPPPRSTGTQAVINFGDCDGSKREDQECMKMRPLRILSTPCGETNLLDQSS